MIHFNNFHRHPFPVILYIPISPIMNEQSNISYKSDSDDCQLEAKLNATGCDYESWFYIPANYIALASIMSKCNVNICSTTCLDELKK